MAQVAQIGATVSDMQKLADLAPDDLLAPRDVMDLTRISRRTLERYIVAGRLKVAKRLPSGQRRFRASDVQALLEPGDSTTTEVAS